jgi:hypothetical protein
LLYPDWGTTRDLPFAHTHVLPAVFAGAHDVFYSAKAVNSAGQASTVEYAKFWVFS